jgi:CelD/BcsL family acetyltransferase involved in cellulose biosynthesis
MGRRPDQFRFMTEAKSLDYKAFADVTESFDLAVDTAGVPDVFCSGSPWIMSAMEAFSSSSQPFIVQDERGWVPLMVSDTVLGRTLMPLEASWGLAAPFIGPDRRALAAAFAAYAKERREDWDAMFLSGLQRGGPDFTAMVHGLGRDHRLGLGRSTVRCVASLEGGLDGFLSRRTRKFRKNIRRAERLAGRAVLFERVRPSKPDEWRSCLDEIMSVERRSWKGMEGHGIDQGPMCTFYTRMVPRLAARQELRVTLARDASSGESIGFVLGGTRGAAYRGLQISFDHAYRGYSLGNLLQRHTIEGLCLEGIDSYDLGTDMAYKRQWSEILLETVPLVIR